MTLVDDTVRQLLRERFVVGWHNIEREPYVGSSHGYTREQNAIGTTNGAGGRNMQVFILSPDLVVLHALPGFWHPDDFAQELRFGEAMGRVWEDSKMTRSQKDTFFRQMQMSELRTHSELTFARSTWQSFDAHAERELAQRGERDTFVNPMCGLEPLCLADLKTPKPINLLVHERMARRPFVPFADFDIAAFVDYGLTHYDNNQGRGDKGVEFRVVHKRAAGR